MLESGRPAGQPSQWGLVVRTGLAAIPFVGGSLVTAWSEWDSNRRFNRVEHTIAELGRLLSEVRQIFDPDRIGEPEMQILEAVLNRVQSEHREKKRRRFAKLVASDWTEGLNKPFEDRMRFVHALDELDELDIGILIYLAEQTAAGKNPSYVEIADAMHVATDQRNQRLLPALNLLASSYGFIRRAWGMSSKNKEAALLTARNLSPEGIARKCEHAITDLGRSFLQAVSLSNVQPDLSQPRA